MESPYGYKPQSIYAHGCVRPCMIGKLIAFIVHSNGNRTNSSMFAKKFYGQETSSNNGRYKYRRKGFLDDIPHIKLIRGVVIVSRKDAKKVIVFLKSYDTDIYIRNVELTPEDFIILQK